MKDSVMILCQILGGLLYLKNRMLHFVPGRTELSVSQASKHLGPDFHSTQFSLVLNIVATQCKSGTFLLNNDVDAMKY